MQRKEVYDAFRFGTELPARAETIQFYKEPWPGSAGGRLEPADLLNGFVHDEDARVITVSLGGDEEETRPCGAVA